MATVTISGLHKHFGAVHAVRGIDLAIPDGEFTVLVGPSGCGKSTLLRAIAGLEEVDAGTIEIEGEVVNTMRPRDRDVAMVFQDYALYPHMTARSNIGLSLRARGMPKPEIATRVGRVAEMLGIGALLDRYPRQLSGGQRQRVAIGRAIVRNPRVFLFDEPLSNLDAQLRDEMRGEIKRLHQEISTTMIYVTHDQIEAMTLADRIVLMREGVIEQQGAPLTMFEQPANLFVAGFLGSPQMNFLRGRLVGNGGALGLQLGDGGVTLNLPSGRSVGVGREGGSVILGLRPEHAGRAAATVPAEGIARVTATIDLVQPTGSRTYATFRLAGERVVAELQAHDVSNPGEEIAIDINLRRASLFDPEFGADVAIGGARMPDVSRAIKLCGTDETDPPSRLLRAGPLSVELEAGNLRYIRVAGIEVLRGIAFLVRDANWGTLSADISDLKIEENGGGFFVSYRGRCDDGSICLVYDATIRGAADGSLSFDASVLCESDVRTNRTGFVVLHPLAGVTGKPARVVHTDGRETLQRFPEMISPGQPMFDIFSLSHEIAPGVWATCTMQGDAFEMEDQRNWSDASYKTYVRPLGKPWPYTLAAGSGHEQSVRLAFSGAVPAVSTSDTSSVEVAIGGETGARLPAIGLGVSAEEAPHALRAGELLSKLGPRLLVCQIDARAASDTWALDAFRDLAAVTGAPVTLEIIVPGISDPFTELAPVAAAMQHARIEHDAVSVFPASDLMSHQPGFEDKTVPSAAEICAATRAAFPGVRLGGGMASYFTELNRKRPPVTLLDFVTHTGCPIVHAADDRSVMETLEALPAIIASTLAITNGKPRRVGPSAIGCRQNPYGAAPFETDGRSRVCLARVDPRQRGVFGAAWTLGYIAAFARGGVEAITMGAPTGPFGAIYRRTDYAQPYFDALDISAVYPAYHVLAGLAREAGQPMIDTQSDRPGTVEAIALREGEGVSVWLCNLTAQPVTAHLRGLPQGSRMVSIIDAASFTQVTTDADWLSNGAKPLNTNSITLDAYAVARVQAS